MKKKILLGGFSRKQILFLKKNNNKVEFYLHKPFQKKIDKIDAFVSVLRKSFENFYYNDLDKYKSSISWVHVGPTGIDKYFHNNELSKKCKLTTGKIIQGPQVADHAMGLLLSLTRNINLVIKNLLKSKSSLF